MEDGPLEIQKDGDLLTFDETLSDTTGAAPTTKANQSTTSTEFDTALDTAENEDDDDEDGRIVPPPTNAATVPKLTTPHRTVALPNVDTPSVIDVNAVTYSTSSSSRTGSGSSTVISALTAGTSSSTTVTTNSSSSSVRTNNRPSSTARNKPKVNKIKKGSRVKTTRSKLYQVLVSDKQRESISPELPNSALFYGYVTKGSSGKGWTVKWDDLPHDDNEVQDMKRQRITVVNEGEEETQFSEKYVRELENQNVEQQKKSKKKPEIQSKDYFCGLDKEVIKDATVYELKYDDKKESILWTIMEEAEYISNDDYFHTLKSHSKPTIDISINYDDPFADNFFDYMWPDLTGSG